MEFSRGERRPEKAQPHKSDIKKLFKDYGELAILRGEIDERPLDPSLPPGNDGTIDIKGRRSRLHQISLVEEKVPPALIARGIDEVKVTYLPSAVLDGEPTNEMVTISLHEPIGVKRIMYFEREGDKDDVDATITHRMMHDPVEIGLTSEQQDEIVLEVHEGNEDILSWDSSAGEYARTVHSIMTNPEMDIDEGDIKMLKEVYPHIKDATQR